MANGQIQLRAVPVLHALARFHGPVSFAELKDSTGLAQATLNRILNQLCEYGYAIKAGHGQYVAGPELVDIGLSVTANQVVPSFKPTLGWLRRKTQLTSELYLITPGGPIFLAGAAARGEEGVPFRYGHVIGNRVAHPAGLFYLGLHKEARPEGYKENFIVDRGGQWPELFRAASMVPGGRYCLAVSGVLANVGEEHHEEIRLLLKEACESEQMQALCSGFNGNGKRKAES